MSLKIGFDGEIAPPLNVLANRYASTDMLRIFSDDPRIVLSRQLWVTVMQSQADLGLPIPPEAIEDYIRAIPEVDHVSLRTREKETKHDVKAGIDEFNAKAGGHQFTHMGMTSRDLTENVEQFQILLGLQLIKQRTAATLGRFAMRAEEFRDTPITARTHNVAAQVTTLGKRFATWGEELLLAYEHLDWLIKHYPMRGIKGPVGTQQDLLNLFGGDEDKVDALESEVAKTLGFERVLTNVSQIYPRSLDFMAVSSLANVVYANSSFATTLRLMAGHGTANEGFAEGQSGSSAMPHKQNPRTAERVNSIRGVVNACVSEAMTICGTTWNEGDVSDSATRRRFIADAFYAVDGLLEATITDLDDFSVSPDAIKTELETYLPFLATTSVLVATLKKGVGREEAHKRIKQHAVRAMEVIRAGGNNDLFERIADDGEIPLNREELDEMISNPLAMTGNARRQVDTFVERVQRVLAENPDAKDYKPQDIL